MDEWSLEFDGAAAPTSVGALMRQLTDEHMAHKLSANQRAALAWSKANGDREGAHTTGVFLKRARLAGAAPILCVYVDSHAMATDFGVNKDIYLARLANVGFEASGIEFLVSREGYRKKSRTPDARQDQTVGSSPQDLPRLDQYQVDEIENMVADVPPGLRDSLSQAISLSMRKQKLQNTQTDERA